MRVSRLEGHKRSGGLDSPRSGPRSGACEGKAALFQVLNSNSARQQGGKCQGQRSSHLPPSLLCVPVRFGLSAAGPPLLCAPRDAQWDLDPDVTPGFADLVSARPSGAVPA